MRKIDRRQVVSKLLKDTVYDSIMEILQEEGGDKITMDAVAAKAGVSKGTLYNYFKNKEDLMDFVEQQTIEPIIEGFAEIRARDISATEKLRQTFIFSFNVYKYRKDYVKYQLGVMLYKQQIETTRLIVDDHFDMLWQQGLDSGEFYNADLLVFKAIAAGAVTYIIDEWACAENVNPDAEKVIDTLLNVFESGFIKRK